MILDIIGGAVLVPFVDYVVKDVEDDRIKFLLAFISSVVMGAIIAIVDGKIVKGNMDAAFTDLLTVFAMSQSVFQLYWKNSLARESFTQRISPVKPVVSEPLAESGTPAQAPEQPVSPTE